jgi:hypothetical protein
VKFRYEDRNSLQQLAQVSDHSSRTAPFSGSVEREADISLTLGTTDPVDGATGSKGINN